MKSMFRLLVALLLVGGWSAAAMALHVIIAPGAGGTLPVRIILLPKDHIAITDSYVDTRHWTLDDVSNHPAVVKRMIAAGKADGLQHVVKPDSTDADLQSVLADALARGPQAPTSAPATAESRDATQAAAHEPAKTGSTKRARHVS